MKKKRFANGLRLVMERRRHSDTVSISLAVRCGSVYENKDESGIAHFLEHMILRGTKNKNYEDIMNSFQSFGGYINARTQKTYTIFSISILKNFLEEAINILSEIIFNPSCRESDIEKEKNVIMEEIHQQLNDQIFIMREELFEQIVNRGNKLSMPILGNEKVIRKMTKNRLANFHKLHYSPDNIAISIVGNIDYRTTQSIVNNYFGTIKRSDNPPQTFKFNIKKLPRKISKTIKKIGISQSHLIIGGRAPLFFEKDRYAMEPLITILGNSMNSRIVIRLINKMGIAYSVGSYYNEKLGYYYSYISTTPKNVKRAFDAILEEIDKLVKNGVHRNELEIAKNYIKGLNAIQQESNRICAEKYATAELFTSADEVIGFNKKINQIKMLDINRVIEKYLKKNNIILKLEPDNHD